MEHTDEENISKVVDEYFEELFKSFGNSTWGDFLDDCHSPITQSMNDSLTAAVSNEEIIKAIKAIGGDRAPGVDGLSGAFYH